MSGLQDAGSALLRVLPPEPAHRLAITALKLGLGGRADPHDPVLATRAAGLSLPNAVGLAAGFDKNGEALSGLCRAGFGFVECGSVTPRPQPGNPRPRLFRLSEDRAVINRMGFNNDGLEAFAARLSQRPRGIVPVGANLGANKDSEDKAADYVTGLTRLSGLADYFTVNISSPNTPGLRLLQGKDALDDLLGRLAGARGPEPLLLKIAPDLDEADIVMIVEASIAHGLDGLIVSNTTLDRPEGLKSRFAGEAGGLSGAPLKDRALRALKIAHEAAQARIDLIGVGGVASGADAYERIRAGARAIQLYSALIYEGPGLVKRIRADLAARLRADGFASVAEAAGAA